MTVEILLLALASSVRPTSLAAVYALLATGAPRRLMTIYVATGLAFTVAFGLLVVVAFHGIGTNSGAAHAKAVAEIVSGLLVLAFAVAVLTGRVGGRHPDDAPGPGRRWSTRLEEHITPRTAALAGPATHIPGLFYLVALNVVVAHHPSVVEGLFEILLYNAIWFLIPLGALVICVIEPATARKAVGVIQGWTTAHARTIVLAVSFGAGAALLLRGLLTL